MFHITLLLTPVEFDAIETTTRNETINSSIKSKVGANIYNNFDTDPSLYVKTLIIDEPASAKDKVIQYSGRVSGGDLKWTFNNAVDDASSAVNTALKAALTSYTTGLLYVQGETPVVINSQTLTSTDNNDQTVASGAAITDMVFTWGGTATDATVTGLPASGINFVKNTSNKTITISGTPIADLSFSVITSGTSGTPVTGLGNITIVSGTPNDEIHNFTVSGKVSTFYAITGNMNSTAGSATYDGLTMTARLKMESTTTIIYTTIATSTLTLVFDPTFSLAVKLKNSANVTTSYTAVAGIVTITSLPAGTYTILKGDTTNLFYIKTSYALGVGDKVLAPKLSMYPNPVTTKLYLSSSNYKIEKVMIYSITGALVKSITKDIESIDVSNLITGSYLVKVITNQGLFTQKIIKN